MALFASMALCHLTGDTRHGSKPYIDVVKGPPVQTARALTRGPVHSASKRVWTTSRRRLLKPRDRTLHFDAAGA